LSSGGPKPAAEREDHPAAGIPAIPAPAMSANRGHRTTTTGITLPVYLNNAAGTYPKPACVIEAMAQNLNSPPVNPLRENVTGTSVIDECRREVAGLFRSRDPQRVAFCSGGTEALNMAVAGLIRKGGHVVTTCMEHNAVLRPLYALRDRGEISLSILPCDADCRIDPGQIEQAIREETCLVAVNHASNVTGTIQHLDEIYAACEQAGVPVIFDLSQSAGAAEIDLSRKPLAVGAFTGHKALMGPPGTGGLYVGEDVPVTPVKFGGTGTRSDLETMPDDFPSCLEPGTPNYPGIAGLCAGIRYLRREGLGTLAGKRMILVRSLQQALAAEGFACHAAPPAYNPCGVVSFCIDGWKCEDAGYILSHSYGIRLRTGLHCAPLVHRYTGTYPDGTIRVSFSGMNTPEEVAYLTRALEEIRGTG
jgi:cysteine desulfurase family protein